MFGAAGKGLEKCMQGCGGKRTEPGYKNSTYDFSKLMGWCSEMVFKVVVLSTDIAKHSMA